MRHGRLVIVASSILTFSGFASAYPSYVTAFKNKYPTTTLDSRLSCTICHTNETYSNNVNCYRKALNQLGSGVDINTRINQLDAVDSDGDGVPNGVEATAARPGGGVGFSPGLIGFTGTDPCGANPALAVSNALETPPDTDGDGVVDALDGCPNDSSKTSSGGCGCGVADVDTDGDSVLDCQDVCPGIDDHLDSNSDGVPDCQEGTSFTVNTTDDTVDANPGDGLCADSQGHCSLRAAIMESNTNADRNTIILPAGNYVLTIPGTNTGAQAGDLNVTDDLTISGAGADTTIIDANHIDRVFDLGSFQAVVTFVGVTITGGSVSAFGGGGIRSVDNTLTLRNCTVRDNALNSTETYGGGIWAGGPSPLVLENCTISGNSITASVDGFGAGVNCYFGGASTITNCTIVNNTANGVGVVGGGIAILSNRTTITNCTIAGNTSAGAPSGIYYDGGGTQSFPLTIQSTIVANTAGGANCLIVQGPYSSLGHNIEDADTCAFDAAGDLVNTDPKLGALGNNGGTTRTMALLANSPAIDAGDSAAGGSADQRGFARPGDGNFDGTATVDIGAVEYSDCNNNGTDDGTEIANGATFPDCNANGIPDACELSGHDCDNNGVLDSCDPDADGDGKPNACDPCPNGGDDSDGDGDGLAACSDGCPDDSAKTSPGACGCGIADTDTDNDGVADCVDNCPNDSNIGQEDSDGDGAGDACDVAPNDPNSGGEPNDGGNTIPADPNSISPAPNCAAGACGTGTATLMPFMLMMLVGMKCRGVRR